MTPRLETERLILREYRLEDFPAHAAIWSHPHTTRNFDGYAYDEEMCWLRFQRHFGQWAMSGYGVWGVEEKSSGRYIGTIGFMNAKRAMDVPYRDAPEAAWVISPDLHGQGLAGEGVAVALAWADMHIPAPQTWCMINPENTISQKVAARFGYARALDGTYKGKPMQTYLRTRSA